MDVLSQARVNSKVLVSETGSRMKVWPHPCLPLSKVACPRVAFWMPRLGSICCELFLSEIFDMSTCDKEKIFSPK